MIRIGRSLRWLNDYDLEINFSKSSGFDFHQLWYSPSKGISVKGIKKPIHEYILKKNFPAIIHALFDLEEFNEYNIKNLAILSKNINSKEIILHPVCRQKPITNQSTEKLSQKLNFMNEIMKEYSQTLFVENNAKNDPINYTIKDIKYLFKKNNELEFLLDVAHIDNYKHLTDLLNIKIPKKIHVSDKYFQNIHEHLSIGKGELNFNIIFNHLKNKNFSGDIILEMIDSDKEMIKSYNIVKNFFINN